jgi:mannose-6-phosphate isomerase-like protein (cupin superfamily)
MQVIQGAGSWTAPQADHPNDWIEHLAVPALSVGTYCIPAGGTDDQTPHGEDEVYVVTGGRAKVWTPDATVDVAAGSVIFVPAVEEHRFIDVAEDLTLLVVFGPAFGSRSDTPQRTDVGGA